jgi:hypothetical protein
MSLFIRVKEHLYCSKRPQTKEELFNLHHASARNVIERIFGVLKKCYWILLLAPEYKMNLQAHIPAALCALHNFIKIHEPEEEEMLSTVPTNQSMSHGIQGEISDDAVDEEDDPGMEGDEEEEEDDEEDDDEDGDQVGIPGMQPGLSMCQMQATARQAANSLHDHIAQAMWDQYLAVLLEQA